LEKRINQISKLETRITELEDHRNKRDEEIKAERLARDNEIAELRAKQQADMEETQKLRAELDALRTRVKAGDEKYRAAKVVIEKLYKALKAANIDVPDLNGGLPDSIRGWRWDDKK